MLRSSKYRMDASAKTEICLRPGAELIHRSGWEWVIFMHHLRRIAVELVPGHHRVAVVGPDKDDDRHQCLREVPGERLGGGKRHHANSRPASGDHPRSTGAPAAGVWPQSPRRLAQAAARACVADPLRSEEHTSELQSLMRNSYAVFCLKQKKQ